MTSRLLFLLAILLFSTCTREDTMQVRKSVYRSNQILSRLGINKKALQDSLLRSIKNGDTQALPDSLLFDEYAPITQKNLINRYKFLYDILNAQQHKAIVSWDSVQQLYYVRQDGPTRLQPQYEVFGWHPYWMGSAWKSYPFRLLSTLAYYAYKIDPLTGNYDNPAQMEEWRSTEMIDSAKAQGCKVLLSIASQGFRENDHFLSNEAAWTTLIDQLGTLLSARQADGIDVNFEQIPLRQRRQFVQFVGRLRSDLPGKMTSGKVFISITLPAFYNRDAFDVAALQSHADLIILAGYTFNGSQDQKGPVAPLMAEGKARHSLQETIDFYLQNGLDTQKAILALPYFGSQWKGEKMANGEVQMWFDKEITYREIKQLYTNDFIPEYDPPSATKYIYLEFPDNTTVSCWYDDAFTLQKKYDLALSKGLKGVALWSLGYDNGYTELWDLIDRKFTTSLVAVSDPIAELEGYPIALARWLMRYRDILLATFLFFAISVVLGLVIAFSDWRVRQHIMASQLSRFTLMLVMTLLLIPLLNLIGWFAHDRWRLLIEFVAGLLTTYLVMKIQLTFKSNRP